MSSRIKEVFEEVCHDLKIDSQLCSRIHQYQTGFVNKNPDHSEFFGGNLLGVQVVRFSDSDKNLWFDEIISTDEELLREKLHVIPDLIGANGVFNVAGDPMNLSLAWVLHRLHNETSLRAEIRREAMIDTLLIMQIKFLTSRLYRMFKYPADRAVAEATYVRLSNKFSIKTEGSWLGVLRSRAEDVISASSIHKQAIMRMDNDKEIVRMINDIQGRIRDMLKNIYDLFLKINREGVRVNAQSSVIEYDGVEALKDKTHGLSTYTRYIKSVVADKNSFIREELMRVICDAVPSCPPKHIQNTLVYVSNNYLKNANDAIDQWISEVMVHSFVYLLENKNSVRANVDLIWLISRLRGVYSSSRSTDPDLLKLRKETENIVRKAIDSRTEAVVAACRTAVLLYIVARAYTMKHYG